MRFFYQFVYLLLVGCGIEFSQGSHNCSSFSDKNHGFGCEMRNVKPEDEILEINVLSKEMNKTDEDIIWVQIRDSKFTNLPTKIFEKFSNMERMMILSSSGFKNLNVSYFDSKLTLLLMKSTDLETIGENAFNGLIELRTLSLNYNSLTNIDKHAFRDLVKMEKIEMVANKIEFLDDKTFENNINLKLILLYNNKLRVISAALFSKNVLLETIQLQNNEITQIEKGFQASLSKVTRLDLTSNLCMSETISLSRYVQWNSHLNKFRDCFNNYVLMQPVINKMNGINDEINNMNEKMDQIREKVHTDLKLIEGKMDNTTELEALKSNLIDFFQKDKDALEKKYKNELENITSHVRTDLTEQIQKKVSETVVAMQETRQEKLVTDDFDKFREEFSSKFTVVYMTFFVLFCLIVIVAFVLMNKMKIMPTFLYSKDQRLFDPSEI